MVTYCAPLVSDLFLFCYEYYFMLSLSVSYKTEFIKKLNSISKYLANDIFDIDNRYFVHMVYGIVCQN